MSYKKRIRVIDFFCGAGGFSEGFRQAGFDVIWAVDLWQPAVDTHKENHPSGITIQDNVIRLSNLPDDEFDKLIPDSEVIIGSPPCTAFSNSNKSGNGDKNKGIELFEAYLKIVARKKFKKNSILKYWLLENVPKVQSHIQSKYSANELGLNGDFELIVKGGNTGVYNAKYFGVPSSRERFFCGEFPRPTQLFTEERELIPLKSILQSLGNPKENIHTNIIDPVYGFSLCGENVSDHHYVQEVAEFEWKKAKQLKQDKGYMGKMSFPENLDKPARTIMATMSVSARESFILGYGRDKYRMPTIREVASLMSFPIDYRFYGISKGTKYKLVGNSVPPRLSFAFAAAIADNEKKEIESDYSRIAHPNDIDFINLNLDTFHLNSEKPRKETSKFKYHIPYFIFNAYRVELTNSKSNFQRNIAVWNTDIHYSQGPRAKIFTPDVTKLNLTKQDISIANAFFKQMHTQLVSFQQLQEAFCMTEIERKKSGLIGPYELLDAVRLFIDLNYDFSGVNQMVSLNFSDLKELHRATLVGYYILYNCLEKMKLI
jgi:DNA (cytosine-5)-methyltransferase 1